MVMTANMEPLRKNPGRRVPGFLEGRQDASSPGAWAWSRQSSHLRGRKARPDSATEREKTGHAHASGDDARPRKLSNRFSCEKRKSRVISVAVETGHGSRSGGANSTSIDEVYRT
jgi:hypothetical protein